MTTTIDVNRLRVITLDTLLAHPFPPREHLLMPWLRQGESAMVWAQTGLGKTMLTLSMALAVAGGGEFLGWRNETPRRVLVVDGEMHAEDLKDRLRLLMPTVTGLDAEAAGQNLHLLPRQIQGAKTQFPDLAHPDGQETVLNEITKHKAELVILDNFATLADVSDENEAAAMSPVLAFLLRLKQANVACVLVHHSGKTGASYRGSSKLATTFETVIGLKPWEDAVVGEGAAFEIEWTKFRGAPHEALRAALVKLERQPDGSAKWVTKPAESDQMRALLDAVRSQKFATQKELAEHLGLTEPRVSQVKSKAIRENRTWRTEWDECLAAALPDPAVADF